MASQRKVRFPLDGTRLRTGFTALKAVISLSVRNRHQRFSAVEFYVDPGTNVTSIALVEATKARLMVPTRTVELAVRTAGGTVRRRVHPGHISVRIPGFEGRDFHWPCHFVDHGGESPQALRGLAGVLDDLDVCFSGAYALEARYGWLILEERADSA